MLLHSFIGCMSYVKSCTSQFYMSRDVIESDLTAEKKDFFMKADLVNI